MDNDYQIFQRIKRRINLNFSVTVLTFRFNAKDFEKLRIGMEKVWRELRTHATFFFFIFFFYLFFFFIVMHSKTSSTYKITVANCTLITLLTITNCTLITLLTITNCTLITLLTITK